MKWLLGAAALLAAGLIAAGVLAGRTLLARDEAVREGLVTRVAHDVERELRERGPDAAAEVLEHFAGGDNGVDAIELRTDSGIVARAGRTPAGEPVELPMFLGPSWRDLAGGPMMPGRGRPPFSIRIWPSPGVGDSSVIAALVTWGSVIAALALLMFAAAAGRGVVARERAASLEAEHRRLEVVTAAGAGLAHRIRNPLATIKATAQVLESHCEAAAAGRAARIVESSIRIESLVDELLRFARPVEVHAEEIDLAETARTVTGRVDASGEVRVHADREHVTSAIEELVANARAFDESAPDVVVSRRGRHALIEVLDRGPGLQIDADRAFEPYVTTRANGTGLGLPAVRGLIRANGGDITLANRDGGGCVATIILPAVTA